MSHIIGILMANAIVAMAQIDYCKLCTDHVACNTTTLFYPNCANAKMIPIKKCWILRKHNEWRNVVAGGTVRNLKPACRMSYMQWDEELAELAAHNVVHCKVNRDKCVKSVRFPRVAQNLGATKYDGNRPNAKMLTQDIINNWYKAINNVERSDIDVIKANNSGKTVPFTTMMEDHTTNIGCAAASYKDGGKEVFLLVCNYGTSNLVGKPVYETCDKPGKKCELKSVQYKNLCSRGEELIKSLRSRKPIRLRFVLNVERTDNSNQYGQAYGGNFAAGYNYNNNYGNYNNNYGGYYEGYNPLIYQSYPTLTYYPPNYYSSNLAFFPQTTYSHNGPHGSFSGNDQNKNNDSGNVYGSNSRNIDNNSEGDRIINATRTVISGRIDMSNANGENVRRGNFTL